MATREDNAGIARAKSKEVDNQHQGLGVRGFVQKFGTKGTGRIHGNGTDGGGINRAVQTHDQN